MPFSTFDQNNKRAGRVYSVLSDAQRDADARNAKAEGLGIQTRYTPAPYILDVERDGRETIKATFLPLPN